MKEFAFISTLSRPPRWWWICDGNIFSAIPRLISIRAHFTNFTVIYVKVYCMWQKKMVRNWISQSIKWTINCIDRQRRKCICFSICARARASSSSFTVRVQARISGSLSSGASGQNGESRPTNLWPLNGVNCTAVQHRAALRYSSCTNYN